MTDDELDTEGHRLAGNDNETVVEGLRPIALDEDDEDPTTLGLRRARR
ncbi:MAG: hypothetical protein ACRDIL_13465 [Candidatus Limnocylindrales bacterium]